MLAALAEFRALSGDVRQAQADATEALERGGAPDAMLTLARTLLCGGKALAAAARLDDAVENSSDRMFEAEARALLAVARSAAGRGAAAREQADLALQAAAATGAPAVQARAALAAAAVALAAENPASARDHAARASQLYDALGQRSGVARAQLALADGWAAEGEATRALQHADLAAAGSLLPELAALLPIVRGEALTRAGKLAEARASFHAALEKLGKAWRDDALVGRVYAGLAAVHTANKDRDAALRNFARAVKALRDTELALPFSLVRAAWASFLATAPLTRDAAREGAEVALEAAAALRDAGAARAESRAREAAAALQQKSA
jgi:tetratricopeptide (TPR) repeat protein